MIVFAVLLGASALYYVAALVAALRPPRSPTPGPQPPVTICKPVRGRDRDFYMCIRSHAVQDYPDFEILFAVRDSDDPAIPEIRRLAAEFRSRRIEVFLTDDEYGPNEKVNGLERLRREARYDVLLVDDSDIQVTPDFLARVVAPLADPGVGLVTCAYRGASADTWSSRLEALWIAADFQPGVLVARLLGIEFALGATMVFRRVDLDRIGGFAPLADYLADDYVLGKSMADLGRRIVLSEHCVTTVLPVQSWRGSWKHRLRWGRTLRACRPSEYAGVLITFAIPLAGAAVALYPTLWPLAGAAVALRLVTAWVVGVRRLADFCVRRYFFLIPVGDVVSFIIWAASLVGRKIEWRGVSFRLHRDGRIEKL